MSSTSLTADVVSAVKGPLGDLGFTKRSGEVFTCVLETDVLGWIGLNRAYRRAEDSLEVNPVVGVRHQAVERVVAELRRERFHAYLPPTVSTPLSQLTQAGRYSPWLFSRGPQIFDLAARLAAAVAEHGLPFMRSASNLEQLYELIKRGQGFAHQLAYRRPVVSLMMGDRVEAERSLEEALADVGDRNDLAALEFRSFAERVRERVAQTP